MTVYRTSDVQLDRVQRILRERDSEAPESTLANVEAATTEHDEYLLFYRKRVFHVPPVPYKQGLWLLALDQELRRLSVEESTYQNIVKVTKVIQDMLLIFHSLVRPLTRFDKLFWRWRSNPFLHAEMAEINYLKSFFCSARTSFRVRAQLMKDRPLFLQRTWPMRKPTLLIGLQSGRG
jgi:hypothetical protein